MRQFAYLLYGFSVDQSARYKTGVILTVCIHILGFVGIMLQGG